jgi:hypothetical protein
MSDMVRRWATATGQRGRVVEVPLPGAYGRAMRDGTLIGQPGSELGVRAFDEWIALEAAAQRHPLGS